LYFKYPTRFIRGWHDETRKKPDSHKTAVTKALMITKTLPITGYIIASEWLVSLPKQLSSCFKK
jgi:hypothetical protein